MQIKNTFIYFIIAIFTLSSCNVKSKNKIGTSKASADNNMMIKSGYSDVNGINMYYEIYGDGKPLVLIHGGGSTIQTNFELYFKTKIHCHSGHKTRGYSREKWYKQN